MSEQTPATAPNNRVSDALAALHKQFVSSGIEFITEFDPDWASSCEVGTPYQPTEDPAGPRLVRWQPHSRVESTTGIPNDFGGLENALEAEVHSDFKAFFSSFWSGSLECTASEGHVSLLQLWNHQDVDRLVENMIGHVLGQRRARAPLTLFVACTEPDSDLILSIENATGAVLLERPGRKPLRTVADSMTELLESLSPALEGLPRQR